jgi:hypothetical protein
VRPDGYQTLMATRTPLRDYERHQAEPSHGLLHWAEETGLAPEGEPEEGVPWHAVLLIVVALGLLIALEITLAFGVAKLVTGHAY